jgi:hypothetical protein
MLKPKLKQLFQRWRLYERESVFWVTICYDIDWVLHLERYFKPDERNDLYDMIFDLFFEYEFHWQKLSARKIALLLNVHHSKIDDILNNAKLEIKTQRENNSKYSAKK